MRQLRVENTLYDLSDEVWRQVNDLLSKAERTRRLTQEMLKDEIPLDQPETEESGGSPPGGTGSGPDPPDAPEDASPVGEDVTDVEDKP